MDENRRLDGIDGGELKCRLVYERERNGAAYKADVYVERESAM